MATSRLNRPGRTKGRRADSRKENRSGRRRSVDVVQRPRKSVNEFSTREARLAYGLGWFGIGVGLAELLVPRRLARTIGVPPGRHRLIQAMGLRELANGVGIVLWPSEATGVWARVAGDIVDMTCLGAAFTSGRANRGRLIATAAAVAGATALDLLCAQQLTRGVSTRHGMTPVVVTLTINRSPEELYKAWRDFSNLPRWMKHVMSVDVTGDRRSHWVVTGPAGRRVAWDAEITEERPNELIAWRSVEGSDVDHRGVIRFDPASGNRGTMVTVEMRIVLPGGTLGSAVAAWLGDDPSQSIKMDLRRFKQVMETGEVITTEGQPAGRADSTSWKYDAATRRKESRGRLGRTT
jgi:uncharacterized membrane protein